MSLVNNQNIIDIAINIVKRYEKLLAMGKYLEYSEFIKSKFCEKQLFINEEQEDFFQLFFEICRVRELLNLICDGNVWPKSAAGRVHLYLILFNMTQTNLHVIQNSVLKYFKAKTREKLTKFLTQNAILETISQKIPDIYKTTKKMDNIMKEVKERVDTIKFFGEHLEQAIVQEQNPPENEKADIQSAPEFNEMESTLKPLDLTDLTPIEECDQEHCVQDEALGNKKESPETSLDLLLESTSPLSPSSKSSAKPPQVRQNITQILREGARIRKREEEKEKVFKKLCAGFNDPFKIQSMLKDIKDQELEAELFEIERKHLLGRISQEDARLAKLAVRKRNKQKAESLKAQNEVLEKKLEEYKRAEEARIREIIRDCHIINENAKEAQANVLLVKRRSAQQVQDQSKELALLIEKQKKEELEYKINLIRQIKRLEHISTNDDTKSVNSSLGISCTLSLTELKEALIKLKHRINEQLKERKEKIQQEKSRRQKLIETTKLAIERNKNTNVPKRPETVKKDPKLNPELMKLRETLEKKRREAQLIEKQSASK